MLVSEIRAAERAFDQAVDGKGVDELEKARAWFDLFRVRFVCSRPSTLEEAASRIEYLLAYHGEAGQELHPLRQPLAQMKRDLRSVAPVPDLASRARHINEAASVLTDDPDILALMASVCYRLTRPTAV